MLYFSGGLLNFSIGLLFSFEDLLERSARFVPALLVGFFDTGATPRLKFVHREIQRFLLCGYHSVSWSEEGPWDLE